MRRSYSLMRRTRKGSEYPMVPQNDARIQTLESEEELLPLVLARYDLSEPVSFRWRSAGLNDVFRMTAGDATYYLKVYRAGWRTLDDVRQELAALRHLHSKGIGVALPIPRRDGEFAGTIYVADRARPMALFQ